jgi:hypothetical protein
MSAIPGAEQSRQLVERETDGERALDQENAIERVGRVGAIAVGEAPGFSENPLALVVAERIGADPRSAGDLPRSKPRRRPCFRHGNQSRPRNRFGSQGGVRSSWIAPLREFAVADLAIFAKRSGKWRPDPRIIRL